MKQSIVLSLILFLFLFFVPVVAAEKTVLVFFYGKGCPHCAKLEPYLEGLVQHYPSLVLKKYEVYFNDSNRELFHTLAKAYDTTVQGVPTVFLGDQVFVGASDQTEGTIKQMVETCMKQGCENPLARLKQAAQQNNATAAMPIAKSESKGLVVFSVFFGLFVVLLFIILLSSQRKGSHKQKKKKKGDNQ